MILDLKSYLSLLWHYCALCLVPTMLAWSGTGETQVRTQELKAAIDSRGEPELILCSQNLDNYGKYSSFLVREPGKSMEEFKKKERGLAERFLRARCDVIAIQEVLGKSEQDASEGLLQLVKVLHSISGRSYEIVVGPSNDRFSRVGFLIAKDRAQLLSKVSYYNVELPKISEKQKQRYFSRGPLEIQLDVKSRGESVNKIFALITFHFKSKSTKGGTDPTGLEFEPFRMEMGEALRRVVEQRHKVAIASGRTVLVLLGDRNSNFDSASAKILEGQLKLKDFQGEAACRLSKRGVPLCKAETAGSQRFFSVLVNDPQTKLLPGTLRYKDIYSWIDEILLPAEALPFAWAEPASDGDYASGVVYEPKHASDHGLVWVAFNW